MDTLVRLESVTKRYEGAPVAAIDDVSLRIDAGEAVAIMGPSGSGKSTLLNLIAGLDRPTAGAVLVGDDRVDQLSEAGAARFRRRQVGMIFQFFNLLDDMTVIDNVLLPAQLGGAKARDARLRAGELIDTLGIGGNRAPPGAAPQPLIGCFDSQAARQNPGVSRWGYWRVPLYLRVCLPGRAVSPACAAPA